MSTPRRTEASASDARCLNEAKHRQTGKDDALIACADQHKALLDCFRNCSVVGWCCKEENEAFWKCYKHERGREATIVGDALSRLFKKSGSRKESEQRNAVRDAS